MRTLLLATLLFTGYAGDTKAESEVMWPYDPNKEALRDEIEAGPMDHPWAGEYYTGDGISHTTLFLSPRGRYFFSHGAHGRSFGEVLGKIRVDDGILRLSAADENWLKSSYHVVPWGPRVYLLSDNEMIRFANYVNAGWEPHYGPRGSFMQRYREGLLLVTGKPKVPEQFTPYFLDGVVGATVVSLGSAPAVAPRYLSEGQVALIAIVDEGRRAGLFVGMSLFVGGERYGSATVHSVEDDRATVLLESTAPKAGLKLSSRENGLRHVAPVGRPIRVTITRKGTALPPIDAAPKNLAEETSMIEARKAGFVVREVARAVFSTVDTDLMSDGILLPEISSQARSMGANAYRFPNRYSYTQYGDPGDAWPYSDPVTFYRIELDGKLLRPGDYRTDKDSKGYRVNWAWTKSEFKVSATKFKREMAGQAREDDCSLLKLDATRCEAWETLRIEDLTKEQRDAFWKTRETRARRGSVSSFEGYSKWNGAAFSAIDARVAEFRRADPDAYAEYERLRDASVRERWPEPEVRPRPPEPRR